MIAAIELGYLGSSEAFRFNLYMFYAQLSKRGNAPMYRDLPLLVSINLGSLGSYATCSVHSSSSEENGLVRAVSKQGRLLAMRNVVVCGDSGLDARRLPYRGESRSQDPTQR